MKVTDERENRRLQRYERRQREREEQRTREMRNTLRGARMRFYGKRQERAP